jgi:ribonuclease J
MVSLTFYGGVNEIGGNKILLQDGDTRVWLDFGKSFTMGQDYYTGWLQPRGINGLGDYFEFDLLPRLPGLYAEKMLENTDLRYEEPEFDGVFISHAHADHVTHICFLDPEIPVYTGEGTKLFMEAMEKTSTYANYGEHDYRSFRTGDRITIGPLELEPIHVDHSIPAAYGYIIHTSGGSLVYTGDLRAHGPKHEMTQEFLEAAEYVEPVAMISEGTRMELRGRRRNLSEAQVLNGVVKVCKTPTDPGTWTGCTPSLSRPRTAGGRWWSRPRPLICSTGWLRTNAWISRILSETISRPSTSGGREAETTKRRTTTSGRESSSTRW